MSWFRKKEIDNELGPYEVEVNNYTDCDLNTTVDTYDIARKHVVSINTARVQACIETACERCGSVYEPRRTDWYGHPVARLVGVRATAFKEDKFCLLNSVNPQDYCPRCEEHLLEIRGVLLWALENKQVVRKEIEKDKKKEKDNG